MPHPGSAEGIASALAASSPFGAMRERTYWELSRRVRDQLMAAGLSEDDADSAILDYIMDDLDAQDVLEAWEAALARAGIR